MNYRSFIPARKFIYRTMLLCMVFSLFVGTPVKPVHAERGGIDDDALLALSPETPPEPPMPLPLEVLDASTGNEWIYINPDEDYVWYLHWDPSIPVTVTIDNPRTETYPDFIDWPITDASGTFHYSGVFDIQESFVVTVTDGTVTVDHTVTPLQVTGYDVDLDDIYGVTWADKAIHAYAIAGSVLESAYSTADYLGNWTIDFSGILDLTYGTYGRVFDCDDDSNCTVDDYEITIPNNQLTISKLGTGSGTVASLPAGIDCGSDCTEGFAPDTVVKLTATASPGSLFTGWGAPCSGLKFCYVTMSTARTVTASFTTIPPGTYPLTVVKGGAGGGTVGALPYGISCGTDCWEFYTTGTTVKLSTVANAGSTFIGWSGACGSMDYCWLSMGSSKYVTANFALTPPGTFPLIVAMKGRGTGTVTSNVPGISCWPDCYEFYTSGSLVRLAAVAAPGSTFTGWSGGCGGTAYCWVTMSQARFVTANWVLNTASIPPLEADLALLRDPFAVFTFLTRPLEALLP